MTARRAVSRAVGILGTALALLSIAATSAGACTITYADVGLAPEGCPGTIPLLGAAIVATTVTVATVGYGIASLRRAAGSAADLANVVAAALPDLTTPPPTARSPLDPGPLGPLFEPGVHDPGNEMLPKERALAELFASEGCDVRHRPADHTRPNEKNPDTIIRTDPVDPGTITEFKTLDTPSSSAVRRNILEAAAQAGGGAGQIAIDGRSAGLVREEALRGLARAIGQARVHSKALPGRLRIVLGDNTSVFYP